MNPFRPLPALSGRTILRFTASLAHEVTPVLAKLLPTNEHPIERGARVALGLGLIAIAFVGPKTPWGFLGVVPLRPPACCWAVARSTPSSASAPARRRGVE